MFCCWPKSSRCCWVLFDVLVKMSNLLIGWLHPCRSIARNCFFSAQWLQHSTLRSAHCIRVWVARAAARISLKIKPLSKVPRASTNNQTWMVKPLKVLGVFDPSKKYSSTTVIMVGPGRMEINIYSWNNYIYIYRKRTLSMVKFWGSKQVFMFDPLHSQTNRASAVPRFNLSTWSNMSNWLKQPSQEY